MKQGTRRYIKFCYLRDIGWQGFIEGRCSGIFAVAPLARLNASDGMPTPLAQEAYDPCHGCATHAMLGQFALSVRVYDVRHRLVCQFGNRS